MKIRLTAGISVATLLAACNHGDIVATHAPTMSAGKAAPAVAPGADGAATPFDQRPSVSLSVTADGAFRPGQPIVLSARVSATPDLKNVRVVVTELARGPGRSLEVRRASLWDGPLAAHASTTKTFTVRYDRPGYYQVAIRAAAIPASDWIEPGAVSVDTVTTVAYLYISERGGGMAKSFESALLKADGRMPEFGTTGAFLERAAISSTQISSLVTDWEVSGTVVFQDPDNGGAITPLGNSSIWVDCVDPTNPGPFGEPGTYRVTGVTDAGGHISLYCPSYTTGAVMLLPLSLNYVQVRGAGGSVVSAGMNLYPGQSAGLIFVAGDRFPTNAYRLYQDFAPRGLAMLGVTMPGPIGVWVDHNSTAGSYYSTSDGVIRLNQFATEGQDGNFVTLHEFGHAVMYRAIEAPRTYVCNSGGILGAGGHTPGSVNSFSCAFVEGFADFFAAYSLAGRVYATGSGWGSRNFEENGWANASHDGARDEGPVAALLLDIVDGSGDVWTNGSDDDAVQWPGSYLTAALRTCSWFSGTTGWVTSLGGIDELVPCLENYANAREGAPFGNWVGMGAYSESAMEPAGWSAATVRALWRMNLFRLN